MNITWKPDVPDYRFSIKPKNDLRFIECFSGSYTRALFHFQRFQKRYGPGIYIMLDRDNHIVKEEEVF